MPIRRFLAACLSASVASTGAMAQSLPDNPLFSFLSNSLGTVQNIHIPNGKTLFLVPSKSADSRTGSILKKGKEVYLTIDGTGRVYKAGTLGSGQISLQRVDSTVHDGYNNMSFEFVHRDTLFSLGGYGFWRINGHLRYFSEGREWYLAPLDRETPFHGSMAYYDSARGSVFFIQPPYIEEATRQREDNHMACIVDMRNRRGIILGRIRTDEGVQPGRFLFASQALGGLVVDDFRSILLLDIAENRVWQLRNKALADRMFGNSQNDDPVRFEHAGSLYRYDDKAGRLDSFPISRRDFEPTGQPVYDAYEPLESGNRMLYTGLGALALLAIAWGAFRFGVRKGSVTPLPKPEENVGREGNGGNGHRNHSAFSSLDSQLIDSIRLASAEGRPFTAQEMNRVLGVARKSLEIQKKMRRESLVRINRRFRELTGLESDLIESRRSEEDKRYYHYVVTPEAWGAYAKAGAGDAAD